MESTFGNIYCDSVEACFATNIYIKDNKYKNLYLVCDDRKYNKYGVYLSTICIDTMYSTHLQYNTNIDIIRITNESWSGNGKWECMDNDCCPSIQKSISVTMYDNNMTNYTKQENDLCVKSVVHIGLFISISIVILSLMLLMIIGIFFYKKWKQDQDVLISVPSLEDDGSTDDIEHETTMFLNEYIETDVDEETNIVYE